MDADRNAHRRRRLPRPECGDPGGGSHRRPADTAATVVGFRDGWRGLLEDRKVVLSNDDRIDRILTRGGTILGTARVNPDKLRAGLDQIRQTLDDNGIDVAHPDRRRGHAHGGELARREWGAR